MNHKNFSLYIRLAYVLIDVGFIVLSTYLVVLFRSSAFPFHNEYDVTLYNLFWNADNPHHYVHLGWLAAIPFFNGLHNLYQTRREVRESIEIWGVIRSVFLAVLTLLSMMFALKIIHYPRTVFALTAIIIMICLCLWRIGKRQFVEFLAANGYNNFNILIIGAGRVGQALAGEIGSRPGLGIKIIGFLDDFKKTVDLPKNMSVLGPINQFEKLCQQEFIDQVFVTIHHDSAVFLDILEKAKELNVSVRVIPQGFDLTTSDFFKYNIGYIPILEYSDTAVRRRQFGKRLFDLIFATIGLIILSPFFVLIAILIKLDSSGPVFYFSKRYGRGGRIFNMWKFRTMCDGAHDKLVNLKEKNEVDGPIFKMKHDPRVTKLGCFLRKYSLDEFPQLINVILGNMSLVGPRPFPIEQIEKEDLNQLKRLEVRPGITGLWQVRGRSDVTFNKLIKWDIWYINNWSFFLDITILFETVPVVLKAKGAY